MGSKHSKSDVREEVARVLPRKWPELEQLHLRFQQEAHRRAHADPQAQFFLSFGMFQAILAPICVATDTDKTQLLAIYNVLDRHQRRKIAALDFFSGLALVVEGKKSVKFEFILLLLDNGKSKTLNKCELMMVLMATVRGLAMFKRSPEVREETMRPLARRLLGDDAEVLRQHVVNKAMADADIIFFMNDLGSETATTADGLLAQQAKLMQTMGYIDYQFARVTAIEDTGQARSAWSSSTTTTSSVSTTTPGVPTRSKQLASVDVLIRKLQNIVYPLPPTSDKTATTRTNSATGSNIAAVKAADEKKRVDARCVQRLVKRISDSGLHVSASEASALVARMTKDQFGLVKCGELIRVMKLWLRDVQKDSLTFWESLAGAGARLLKSTKQCMDHTLLIFDASARTIRVLSDDIKAATQLIECHQDEHHSRSEQRDHELQYTMKLAIGDEQRDVSVSDERIKFRIDLHSASDDTEEQQLLLQQSRAQLSDVEDMVFVLDLGLKQDVSDEDALDLASAVEQWLINKRVWCHFAPIWQSCQVTVGTATRAFGVLLPSIKYLRVTLVFVEDFFESFQSETGVDVSALVSNLSVSGELDKSVQEYVNDWTELAHTMSMLVKHESRESILKRVFTAFDADHNGVLDLQEFNTLQQALQKSAIDENGFREIFSDDQPLSFTQFAACYEHCSAADIADVATRIGIGSINDAVSGSVSLSAVLYEPKLREIEHLLSPLRWGDMLAKKLLFWCRATNDLSCDLRFPSLLALLRAGRVSDSAVTFLADASLPARALEYVRELLSPVHSGHEKDQVCQSLFCSIAEDVGKTPQQLEFEDFSRGVPTGSTALRVDVLRKFLAAMTRLTNSVETLERLELRCASLRIVCEFENVRMQERSESTSGSGDTGSRDAATKQLVDAAVRERHNGNYRAAIAGFEKALEVEDSDVVWGELALAQFQHWQHYATALHRDAVLPLSRDAATGDLRMLLPSLLQEAYNTFIIAMEYPVNKQNPALLLHLAHLYVEYAAYRGALSVCTLLVEGYTHFAQLPDAVFLSAVTASALGKHRESAQYFQYLLEKPPHRLATYQLHLLAARELERVPGMRDHARAAYAEAYRTMIALAPVTTSEKNAHAVYTTSRASESRRAQLWYDDDTLWCDLARKLASLGFALLVLRVLDVVRQRRGDLPVDMLVLEGVAHHRTGNVDAAEASLARAIELDPHSKLLRFLLSNWSARWQRHFVLELASATRIQRIVRRSFRRQHWRLVAQLLVAANHCTNACTIQCAWRQHCARCELQRLRDAQRARECTENVAMALHDIFVIRKQLNAAARTIQTLHAVFVAKRERRMRATLHEHHAAMLSGFAIQRAAVSRARVLRAWCVFVQLQQRERSAAASMIQRCVRTHRCRRVVARLLVRRQRVEKVLEMCVGKRAASAKRLVFATWLNAAAALRCDKVRAATMIQAYYRTRLARRRYRVALRRHQITLELMHRMTFDRRHRAMLRCWAALSAHAVHRRLHKRASAVLIQKRVRGMLGRRRARTVRLRQRRVEAAVRAMRAKSAQQLLALAFESLARNIEISIEQRSASALELQRVYRGYRARRRVRVLRECHRLLDSPDVTLKHQPRVYVLRLCFLVLARFPEQQATERYDAATCIQRAWRHRRQKRRLCVALTKLATRRAILRRLQASFAVLARSFFCELRKRVDARKWRRTHAARTLQRALRQWLTRRRYARVVEHQALAHARVEQLAHQKRCTWLAQALHAWRDTLRELKRAAHVAATRIQRKYRARMAQRRAGRVVAKKAAQARLLANASQKPLERCFRQWEALLLERCKLSVRSAVRTLGMHADERRRLASKAESRLGAKTNIDTRTLEQRAEVPPLLFYTMLNRVRASGVCQLSLSCGGSFGDLLLRQLLELASSVICDGGGGSSTGSLVEHVVDSLHASGARCPAQKLIFYNAALDNARASKLSQWLGAPNSSVVSLVLGNIPLRIGAVVALAGALCHGHSRLEQLVLESCGIGSAGATALFEALCHNERLWKLDLSRNHITDSACSALARALVTNTHLAVLYLNENALSDRGVLGYLAPALEAATATSSDSSGSILVQQSLQQLALRENARISTLGRTALERAAELFNTAAARASAATAAATGFSLVSSKSQQLSVTF